MSAKAYLKNQLSSNLLHTIEELLAFWIKSSNMPDNAAFNNLIQLKGRLLTAEQDLDEGVLSRSDYNVTRSQILKACVKHLDDNEDFFNLWFKLPKANSKSIIEMPIAYENKFEYDLFFSFSSKDKHEAKEVVDRLRGFGFKVFFSDESLKEHIGESFKDRIEHALVHSHHFIWHCSPNSAQSEWVRAERDVFLQEFHMKNKSGRNLFILKAQDFKQDDVPYFYRTLQLASSVDEIINKLSLGAISKKNSEEEALMQSQLEEKRKQEELELKRVEAKLKEESEAKRRQEEAIRQSMLEKQQLKADLERKRKEAKLKEESEAKRRQEEAIRQSMLEKQQLKADLERKRKEAKLKEEAETKRRLEYAFKQSQLEEAKRKEQLERERQLKEQKELGEKTKEDELSQKKMEFDFGLITFLFICMYIITIINYSIRFYFFSYYSPLGTWGYMILPLFPSFICALFLALSIIYGNQSREGMSALFFFISLIIFLLELIYPTYNFYAYPFGLLDVVK